MEIGIRVGGISTGTFPNFEFFSKAGARGVSRNVGNKPTYTA